MDEAADQVLAPFLRLKNRPRQNANAIENAKRSAERYLDYFNGIIKVAGKFQTIIQETLDSMNAATDPFSDFQSPS
ncbi:hypothetical protein K8I31_15995 [bacterium]|nr:hypothetical protein [bacterium]